VDNKLWNQVTGGLDSDESNNIYIPVIQLTGYATESNEKKYLLFYASDSRH